MEDVTLALISNQLDSLDRLFDGKVQVIDVYAVTFATARALMAEPLFPLLSEAASNLERIVSAGLPSDQQREQALDATDELRIALAELEPWEGGNL